MAESSRFRERRSGGTPRFAGDDRRRDRKITQAQEGSWVSAHSPTCGIWVPCDGSLAPDRIGTCPPLGECAGVPPAGWEYSVVAWRIAYGTFLAPYFTIRIGLWTLPGASSSSPVGRVAVARSGRTRGAGSTLTAWIFSVPSGPTCAVPCPGETVERHRQARRPPPLYE